MSAHLGPRLTYPYGNSQGETHEKACFSKAEEDPTDDQTFVRRDRGGAACHYSISITPERPPDAKDHWLDVQAHGYGHTDTPSHHNTGNPLRRGKVLHEDIRGELEQDVWAVCKPRSVETLTRMTTYMKKMATTRLYRSPCRFNFSTMLCPGLSLFSVRALPKLVLSR